MELLLELLVTATVTITDERLYLLSSSLGTIFIAENAAGLLLLQLLFLQLLLKLLLVSLEYTGTTTNGGLSSLE
jgi:hypothetical protein